MAEISYPVVGQPMGADSWQSVTMGMGDGILDEGGQPYSLTTLSNATNTAVVTVDSAKGYAHAILRGFYHKITSAVTVSLPAVTTTTTYYVALQYDPLRASMPVKLVVVTSLDRTQGKAYLPLHTVRRAPDQLLTQATISTVSAKISPQIQVDTSASLPPASSVLWGTKAWCWRENAGYRASWGSWVPITGYNVQPNSITDWAWGTGATGGIAVQPIKGGWQCSFSGTLRRTGASYTYPQGTWATLGSVVPAGFLPRDLVVGVAIAAPYFMFVRIGADGVMQLYPYGSAAEIKTNWEINFQFSWTAVNDLTA